MEPLNIDQDILADSAPNSYHNETKLCIIIDSKTPIIMRVPITPDRLTLGQFKRFASLQDGQHKFYFKSQDSEFGVVKEEVVDDESSLPVDGDRIVAWVISNNTNKTCLFELESSHDSRLDDQDSINATQKTMNFVNNFNSPSYENVHMMASRQMDDIIYITVQLNLNDYNFLGLTLVGPSDENGLTDGGIHVGEIAKNSVVEQDGRIEIGDRIVEINGLDVRDMKNDDAVALFRGYVEGRGAIKLVLQRNIRLGLYNKGRFTLPREYANVVNYHTAPKVIEPRYPRDDLPIPEFGSDDYCSKTPNTLHSHSYSHRRRHDYQKPNPPNVRAAHSLPRSITPSSLYTTSNFENLKTNQDSRSGIDSRSVYEPTTPTSIRHFDVALHCGRDDIQSIYAALKDDANSLDIRDREWLKVVVKDAFLGSSLVKWLSRKVYGFGHKREVKRFANQMLTLGLIRNPITGGVFSEKCYYTLS